MDAFAGWGPGPQLCSSRCPLREHPRFSPLSRQTGIGAAPSAHSRALSATFWKTNQSRTGAHWKCDGEVLDTKRKASLSVETYSLPPFGAFEYQLERFLLSVENLRRYRGGPPAFVQVCLLRSMTWPYIFVQEPDYHGAQVARKGLVFPGRKIESMPNMFQQDQFVWHPLCLEIIR